MVYILNRLYKDISFVFIGEEDTITDERFKLFLDSIKNKYSYYFKIEDIITDIDILYINYRPITKNMLTIIPNESEIKPRVIINNSLIKKSKDSLIIMHPLPRGKELPIEMDNNSKSKYFAQVENGVYVRMSIILDIVLNNHCKI